MTRLDIGCGYHPTGDINCDRYRIAQTSEGLKPSKADIICTAEYLPFQDKTFDEVYSCQAIEHMDSPIRFVQQAHQIARKKITIVTPTLWCSKDTFHKWSFRRKWFHTLGFKTKISDYRPLPFRTKIPFPIKLVITESIYAEKDL